MNWQQWRWVKEEKKKKKFYLSAVTWESDWYRSLGLRLIDRDWASENGDPKGSRMPWWLREKKKKK